MIRIRPRTAVAVLATVALVAGLGACSRASDVLDTDDRNRFVESAGRLHDSFVGFDAAVQALVSGEVDVATFVDDANGALATMRTEADALADLAGDVDGDASEIAESAASAANDVVEASESAVTAIEASDEPALAEATLRLDAAINAFNEQVDAWNEL